jgi:hypothetical protein
MAEKKSPARMRAAQPVGPYKKRPAGSMKAAVAELVTLVGGLDRAAELLQRSRSQVARYTDAAEADVWPGIDQIRILESVAGEPIVTEFLAHEQWAMLLRLPLGEVNPPAADMAQIAERASDLFQAYGEVLRNDGAVDNAEAGRLIQEIDEMLRAGMTARRHLVAVRDQEGRDQDERDKGAGR